MSNPGYCVNTLVKTLSLTTEDYLRYKRTLDKLIDDTRPPLGSINYEHWLYESLLVGLAEFTGNTRFGRPDYRTAARCWRQVALYLGQSGGHFKNPVAHDASIALQNALLDLLPD